MIEKIRLTDTVPNLTKLVDGGGQTRVVLDRMRQSIAARLVQSRVEERVREFHTEYAINLVVATEDEYWRDVENAARRMATELSLPPLAPLRVEG